MLYVFVLICSIAFEAPACSLHNLMNTTHECCGVSAKLKSTILINYLKFPHFTFHTASFLVINAVIYAYHKSFLAYAVCSLNGINCKARNRLRYQAIQIFPCSEFCISLIAVSISECFELSGYLNEGMSAASFQRFHGIRILTSALKSRTCKYSRATQQKCQLTRTLIKLNERKSSL